MNLVRDLGMAAAKARGGIAYERLEKRSRLGEWELSEDAAERVAFSVERSPIFYMLKSIPHGRKKYRALNRTLM
jgi:hypothetical protein